MKGHVLEFCKVVGSFVPIDTTGAARTGDWVNLKRFRQVMWVIMQGAWAAGTPAVTIQQATSNAGAGAKTLSFAEYWQGVTLTDDLYAKTAVVSDTFNLPAVANTITMGVIHAAQLDTNNGFTHIAVNVASPGASADLICGFYVMANPNFSGLADDSLPETVIN